MIADIIWSDVQIATVALGGAFTVLWITCIVQLIRVHRTNPAYCITVQKLVHLLIFAAASEESAFYPLSSDVDKWPYYVFLSDVPSVLFLSVYTILILFWAEVYHQKTQTVIFARLRLLCLIFNIVVYLGQAAIWTLVFVEPDVETVRMVSIDFLFYFGVLVAAFASCIYYSGRLWCWMHVSPNQVKSSARLRTVGIVTVLCTCCLLGRAVLVLLSYVFRTLPDNWWFIALYYVLCELAPCVMIIFALRPRTRALLRDKVNERTSLVNDR